MRCRATCRVTRPRCRATATAGHYRKRGAVAAVIALVAFVIAGFLAYRIVKADKVPVASSSDVLV